MAEKRYTVRRRSFIPASIATAEIVVPCTILDISKSGAKLRLPPGFFLCSPFYVRAPELGKAIPSRIVWRSKGEMGVRFR